MLFDTEFLICAAGQRGRPRQRLTLAFLATHHAANLFASRVSLAEFAEGMTHRHEVDEQLVPYAILEVDMEVAWRASRLARSLQALGQPIADNDLWIAATALEFGLPLVSNNRRHFARVPGLDLRAN